MGTNHRGQAWMDFCKVIGLTALVDDPRFADEESRMENAAELVPIIDEAFLTKTRDEWMALFLEHGLMFTPVQGIDEVLTDPQALANAYVYDFDHPVFGKVKMPGYPIQFGANYARNHTLAPKLGEHTDAVLNEMGLTVEEIQELKDKGIVQQYNI